MALITICNFIYGFIIITMTDLEEMLTKVPSSSNTPGPRLCLLMLPDELESAKPESGIHSSPNQENFERELGRDVLPSAQALPPVSEETATSQGGSTTRRGGSHSLGSVRKSIAQRPRYQHDQHPQVSDMPIFPG